MLHSKCSINIYGKKVGRQAGQQASRMWQLYPTDIAPNSLFISFHHSCNVHQLLFWQGEQNILWLPSLTFWKYLADSWNQYLCVSSCNFTTNLTYSSQVMLLPLIHATGCHLLFGREQNLGWRLFPLIPYYSPEFTVYIRRGHTPSMRIFFKCKTQLPLFWQSDICKVFFSQSPHSRHCSLVWFWMGTYIASHVYMVHHSLVPPYLSSPTSCYYFSHYVSPIHFYFFSVSAPWSLTNLSAFAFCQNTPQLLLYLE